MPKRQRPTPNRSFQYRVLNADMPVFVRFTAAWCGPCQEFGPDVEKVASLFSERKLKFVTIDIDQNPQVTSWYDVSSVPHVILFRDGDPVGRLEGRHRVDEMLSWLKENDITP